MTVRSVIISFFVLAISFGMVITNQFDDSWAASHGNQSFMKFQRTPYLNYSDINVPTTKSGYNNTVRDIMTYNKPEGVVLQFDFFQALKFGTILTDLLFTTVFGFPEFLVTAFSMPYVLMYPLVIFLVLNHILALIYIVTGRTFIY